MARAVHAGQHREALSLEEGLGIYLLYAMIRSHLEKRFLPGVYAGALLVLLVSGLAGWMMFLDFQHHPHYSPYVAKQGGGNERRGFYFPQDDFYDAGLRESIAWISSNSPRNSVVLGTTPSVVAYYTGVFGRSDLKFQSTVDPDYKPTIAEAPVEETIDLVSRTLQPATIGFWAKG
jgi:hypothetical protein